MPPLTPPASGKRRHHAALQLAYEENYNIVLLQSWIPRQVTAAHQLPARQLVG